jgi:hypothetical protein
VLGIKCTKPENWVVYLCVRDKMYQTRKLSGLFVC